MPLLTTGAINPHDFTGCVDGWRVQGAAAAEAFFLTQTTGLDLVSAGTRNAFHRQCVEFVLRVEEAASKTFSQAAHIAFPKIDPGKPNPDKVASLTSRNQIDFTSHKDAKTTKKNNKKALRLCVRFSFCCANFSQLTY